MSRAVPLPLTKSIDTVLRPGRLKMRMPDFVDTAMSSPSGDMSHAPVWPEVAKRVTGNDARPPAGTIHQLKISSLAVHKVDPAASMHRPISTAIGLFLDICRPPLRSMSGVQQLNKLEQVISMMRILQQLCGLLSRARAMGRLLETLAGLDPCW